MRTSTSLNAPILGQSFAATGRIITTRHYRTNHLYCGPHALAGGVTAVNGVVSRSIEARNFASLLRSWARVNTSRPSIRPAVRCVTFSSTASSDGAAPLCRYGALANTEMSDGTLKPRLPRAWTFAALLARISLLTPSEKSDGSNVPTRHRNRTSCASTTALAAGGGVKSSALIVQFGPPWQFWQPASSKSARPRLTPGS